MPPLVAVGLVVVGCMNPPAESTSAPAWGTAPSPDRPSCPASGVAVSAELVDAAMGLRVATLTLANCGTLAYSVGGYPGLALLDEQQQTIDAQVIEEPDPLGSGAAGAPVPLTLVAGQRAQAVLLWRNTVEMGEATPGSYLAVTPSPGEEQQVVALDVDLGTTGRLTIGPWAPAA